MDISVCSMFYKEIFPNFRNDINHIFIILVNLYLEMGVLFTQDVLDSPLNFYIELMKREPF